MSAPEGKSPMNVKCGKCNHVWTAAWLPMEMRKVAKVIGKLHCPACGNDAKDIYLAPSP